MRFSWKAVALAPLAMPFALAIVSAATSSQGRLFSFGFFFALGCILSYGVSLFLFVPCLFVLSRFTPLTAWLTSLIGTMLGLAVYFLVCWQSYRSSGDNSGPPSGSFMEYLRYNFWSESWLFYVSGLVTAILYWLLSKPRPKSVMA